jgi:serine protease
MTQCGGLPRKASGVPLRFPRPVAPVIAAGMTAIWVVAASAPALADQTRHQEWWLSKLGVSQAWQASRGHGVTVAVLSDGVDSTQPDLAGSVTVGPDFTNTNETATTYVGLQGTPIASLIAGHGSGPGGTSGIIGVAPQARILSVRVTLDVRDPALDSATTGAGLPDAIATGIRYAVAHHAKVIDLPLDPGQPNPAEVAALPIPTGTGATTPPQLAGIAAAQGGSTEEAAAVTYALRHNVVLVAPAGDNASTTDAVNYPAAYRGVISVGGFGEKFSLAPYSSRQPYVTLTAPGEDVLAADAAGGYQPVNSTTAASAIASGIAALIRSRYPGLSVAQVRHAMTSSTMFRSIPGMKHGAGFGTVNAERALAAAGAAAAPASQRAGSGSLPLSKPAAPAAPTVQSDALKPRVLRAGLYAGGVLVILLLLIAAYALLRGRRKPQPASRVSDWNPNPQPAYSPYGSGDPDRMAEFLAAPATAPAPATGPFPQFQSAHFQAGQAASAHVPAGGAALVADGDGRRVGAWLPVGSGARGHSKPPNVSGRPPWEPAPKPDSELPWAVPATPRRAAARPAVPASHPAPAALSEPDWPVSTGGTTPAEDTAATPAPDVAPPAGPPSMPAGSAGPQAAVAPAANAVPAAPSPTGQAWEDLTDSSMRAIRDTDGPPAAALPQRVAPAPSSPRSPSGSDWERPDTSEPAIAAAPAEAADAPWDSADGDAYRPAPADTRWQAPGGGARWRRAEPGEARRTRSSSGTHRKTSGRGPDARAAESRAAEAAGPKAGDTGGFRAVTAPGTSPPAPAAQPDQDAGPGWPAGESDNRWQSLSEARWELGPEDGWPGTSGQPPWEAAEPASESRWPESDEAEPEEPAAGKWQPDDSRWLPGASESIWVAPAGDQEPGDQDDEDPFAWRPGAQTETFPAIGEDS